MTPEKFKMQLRTASKRHPALDPSEYDLSGSLIKTVNRNVVQPSSARAGPSRPKRTININSSPPSSSALSSPPPLSSSSPAGLASRPDAPSSRSDNPRGGLASKSNVRRLGKKSVTVPTPTESSSTEEVFSEEEASEDDSSEERHKEERQNGNSRRAIPIVEIVQRPPRQQKRNTLNGSEEYRVRRAEQALEVTRAEMELLRTELEEMRQQNAQLVQRMSKLEEQVEAQGKANEQHAARAQEQDLRVAEIADYAKDLEADVEPLTNRIKELEEGYAEPDGFEAATFTGDAASNDVQDAAPDSSYQPTFGSSRTVTSGGW